MPTERSENSVNPNRRDFHIGDILSITTGHLVSPRYMEGIYDILNFMTGDNLFTHQLIRATEECRPNLLQQHPQLVEVDAGGVNAENWQQWLGQQAIKYGIELPVEPLPLKNRTIKDPFKELEEMVGPDRIINVNLEDFLQE